MNNLDALLSDGENSVKFVRNGEEAELELENKKLMFEICSNGCLGKKVVACFDSADSDSLNRGGCSPGQCEFKAGVSEVAGTNFLWFTSGDFMTQITDPNGICATAIMEFPYASVSVTLTDELPSCEPLKHDGNVVKLYIIQAPPGCPLYVLNAKKWSPQPSTTATQNTTEILETKETTSESSESNTTLWILIGVGIFIFLIVIGFGYCCYRTQLQKKPLFGKKKDLQQKAFNPEASKNANAVKEINEDEKEVVAKPEPSKEATKEESIVTKEKQPTKKKAPKEKKAIVVVPKPSKEITQENGTNEDAPSAKKSSIEPTLQDPTTDASVVQKSVIQQKHPGNPPRVFVPKKVILPAKNSDGFKSVSILDTLSGKEDYETQHSTHASEKLRKNESAGRKKGSKKHR
uniref:Uncharacterized protein n=1 Tax=Panagrolaimus davidi TaxID=227884 RepID=A0A914R6T4_9BILA